MRNKQSDNESSLPEVSEGYPLGALFVLIAACAMPMAMVASIARAVDAGEVGADDAGIAATLGGAGGAILGLMVGLLHYRQTRGVLLGLFSGVVVGSVSGPLAVTPSKDFWGLVTLAAVGSVLLVAVGAVIRMITRPHQADAAALSAISFTPQSIVPAESAPRSGNH